MKGHHIAIVVLFLLIADGVIWSQQEEGENNLSGHQQTPHPIRNTGERLEWLQDAGFGMFVHWSLDSQIGSVISHSMVGASDDYLMRYYELIRTLNPKHWDAEELAILAKLCGMKYIVFTVKHHNGFCWWNTKTTNLNIMNTPYGRDVLIDYVKACRKHDLAVGFYYSPEDFDWMRNNGFTITRDITDFDPNTYPPFTTFVKRQVSELMRQYGQVDVFFIDGRGEIPTRETVWQLQPHCLVTRGAIQTPEQTVPGIGLEGAWESNLTMGTQWAYKPTNETYKSAGRMIEILIETRAKGGALLLNVGPKPNGELPIEQEERLREIALWNMANSEGIHDTRPWIITNEDKIWFTKKKDSNTIYCFVTRTPDWPRGERREFVLKSAKATPTTKISVLGQNDKVVEYQKDNDPASRFEQKSDGLHVSVVRAQRLYNNHKWPNPICIKIENVEPALVPPMVVTKDGRFENGKMYFQAGLVSLGDSKTVQTGFRYRAYAGFAENMESDDWDGEVLTEQDHTGEFSIVAPTLAKGTHEVQAFAIHTTGLRMYGDKVRIEIK